MDRRRVAWSNFRSGSKHIRVCYRIIVRLDNPLVNSGSKVGTRIQQLLRWATLWPQ